MTRVATAIFASANRAAPYQLLSDAKPEAYWDPTSSRSHRPGNSKPQTMSDKLVAATEDNGNLSFSIGYRLSAILMSSQLREPPS